MDTPRDPLWTDEALTAFCSHADAGIRAWALQSLGSQPAARILTTALDALRDPDAEVVLNAVNALEDLGESVPLEALQAPLQAVLSRTDLPPGPILAGRDLLARRGDPEALDRLAEAALVAGEDGYEDMLTLADLAPARCRALLDASGVTRGSGAVSQGAAEALAMLSDVDDLPVVLRAIARVTEAPERNRPVWELLARCGAEAVFPIGDAPSEVFCRAIEDRADAWTEAADPGSLHRWLSVAAYQPMLRAVAAERWRDAIAWCHQWLRALPQAPNPSDDTAGLTARWGSELVAALAASTRPDALDACAAACVAITRGERVLDAQHPFDTVGLGAQFARCCGIPRVLLEPRRKAFRARWLALAVDAPERGEVTARLAAILASRAGLVKADGLELAATLPGLSLPPEILTEDPGQEDDEVIDARVECLIAQPESLRALAPLALDDETPRHQRTVLEALGHQNQRWAAEILQQRFARLLTGPYGEFMELAVDHLGATELLPAVIDAWRPREGRLAVLAMGLARRSGRESTVPQAIRDEAVAEEARKADLQESMVGDSLAKLFGAARSRPLVMETVCNRCHRTGHYDVTGAVIHPDMEASAREGWDGVVFDQVIVCKFCGTEDDYTLGPMAKVGLLAQAVLQVNPGGMFEGEDNGKGPRVQFGIAGLSDGTRIRRASDGIRHWTKKTEQDPGNADAWLRLGNLLKRNNRHEPAVAAYRRVLALRPLDLDASASQLQSLVHLGRGEEIGDLPQRVMDALTAYPADGPLRAGGANVLTTFLELVGNAGQPVGIMATWIVDTGGREVVAASSSIDLRRVTRWDQLEAFIAHPMVKAMKLKAATAEDRGTGLEHLVEGDAPVHEVLASGDPEQWKDPPSALPYVRSTPRVGRNDPCPCGSGKKYKKCCLDKA